MTPDSQARRLTSLPLGTRVVIRRRIVGGATDVLGYLESRDATSCTVQTRSGPVRIPLADVVAAKPIPEPPEPRRPRGA